MIQSKFLSKAARVLQILALAGFLLPFITVSCGGMTLFEFSGVDLVVGGEPSGMGIEMLKSTEQGLDELAQDMEDATREMEAELGELDPAAAPEAAPEPKPEKQETDLSAEPEPWAIVALFMILVGIAVAFFQPNRNGLKATIAVAALALACMIGLYTKAKSEVGDKAKKQVESSSSFSDAGDDGMPGMTSSRKKPEVEVKPGIGYVCTFVLLIVILVMAIRALKKERWDEEIATVGPPGGPPPMGGPPYSPPPPGSPPPGAA